MQNEMNRFVFQTEPMLFLHFMQRYIFFYLSGNAVMWFIGEILSVSRLIWTF